MRLNWTSSAEEPTPFATALNYRESDVDDRGASHGKISDRLSPAPVARKAVAAVWAPGPTTLVELKVDLHPRRLTANFVDDIPVEIV